METTIKLKYIVGILLIISSFTHIIQIFYIGGEGHTIGAALFGVVYGIIGFLIISFKESKNITLLCAILPIIGGTLGLIRFIWMILFEEIINYFIIFHLIVDIIVVPISFYLYFKMKK
ncbi:MAG: hypothetical protein ACTSQJ_02095 [Promethearchaeota archaeon]